MWSAPRPGKVQPREKSVAWLLKSKCITYCQNGKRIFNEYKIWSPNIKYDKQNAFFRDTNIFEKLHGPYQSWKQQKKTYIYSN